MHTIVYQYYTKLLMGNTQKTISHFITPKNQNYQKTSSILRSIM